MPNLATIQEQIEKELCATIVSAWGVAKIHTAPRETETKLSDLPLAFCILRETQVEEEGGSLCSESGRLQWALLLQARKPAAATLASDKRAKAQALRSAIKGQVFTHAPEMRWEGEQYDPKDDPDVEAIGGDYLIRVQLSCLVEWDDTPESEGA